MTNDPQDKLSPMVNWYDPRQLLETAKKTAISTIIGENADPRVVAAAKADGRFFDYSEKFDFDTAKEFDSLREGDLAKANAALKAKGLQEIAVPDKAPSDAGGASSGGEMRERDRDAFFERN